MTTTRAALVAMLLQAGCSSGTLGGDTGEEGPPCGEDGICTLRVDDPGVECSDDPDTGGSSMTATVTGPGTVEVVLEQAEVGCCPEIAVEGTATVATARIDADYTLSNDMCDCICALDVWFTLEGIPSGTWLLRSGGLARGVTVP